MTGSKTNFSSCKPSITGNNLELYARKVACTITAWPNCVSQVKGWKNKSNSCFLKKKCAWWEKREGEVAQYPLLANVMDYFFYLRLLITMKIVIVI